VPSLPDQPLPRVASFGGGPLVQNLFKLDNEGEIKISLGDRRRRTTDALPLRDVPLPVRDFLFGQVSRGA
jgi:hypothetical protein